MIDKPVHLHEKYLDDYDFYLNEVDTDNIVIKALKEYMKGNLYVHKGNIDLALKSFDETLSVFNKETEPTFSNSINLAKWNIYMIALADCAFYTFSYLINEKDLKVIRSLRTGSSLLFEGKKDKEQTEEEIIGCLDIGQGARCYAPLRL